MTSKRNESAPPFATTNSPLVFDPPRADTLLAEAAQALRGETSCDEESGKFTRARVLASLHQSTVQKRTRLAFVLPLAASFAAATAWGTVSGRTQAIAGDVARALGFSVEEREASPPKAPVRRAARPSPVLAPQPPAKLPEPEVPDPPPQSLPPAPAPSAEVEPSHLLYRTAHRAHFVEQDCERAVTAWSAYLRAAPNGRFAPEARYNRALCWVRLGDRAAARTALTPFASGEYGTYRQREARALIEALER